MPMQERIRDYSTLNQSAEICLLQLSKEVDLAPGVGRNSHLEGTGFNLPLEMGRFFENYNQNIKAGKNSLQALMISTSELEANIRTFIVEYIQTKTVLPHVSRLEEVDGRVRMVGQNGIPVIAGITAEERNGAALEASVKVEDFMTDGGSRKTTNRISVINSPGGHSGRRNEQGKAINYKVNQAVVSWTDGEGNLHGLTIVSDLDQDQSRRLSLSLGANEALLTGETEEERVASIVRNPALFSYGKAISNPAKYVFEKILAIRGDADIRLEQEDEEEPEYRSVAQTWEDLEEFESLLQFKPFWEKCLKDLRKTVLTKAGKLDNSCTQAEISKAIEETILDITVDYLQQIKSKKFTVPNNVIYFKPAVQSRYGESEARSIPIDRYAVAAAFLRTKGGCNGGGGSVRTSMRGVSFGSSVSSGIVGERGSGACAECGKPNLDNHYHCPDCNKEYADETNTTRTSVCACGFEFGCGSSGEKEESQEDIDKVS